MKSKTYKTEGRVASVAVLFNINFINNDLWF